MVLQLSLLEDPSCGMFKQVFISSEADMMHGKPI